MRFRPLLLLFTCAGALAPLLAAGAGADVLTRITDLRPGADDGLDGLAAAVLDGQLWFVGRPPGGGSALWRYDGVNPPTMVPGSDAADPAGLVAWNGKLYFGGGPNSDRELWVHDPVGGTVAEAVDVRASGNAVVEDIEAFGAWLCFAAFGDTTGRELFCWDGSGPADAVELNPGAGDSYPSELHATASRLYVVAQIDGDVRLWSWNGADPPSLIAAAPSGEYDWPCCLASAGGETYFEAFDSDFFGRLWRHDGVNPPEPVSADLEPDGWTGVYRNRLVLGATNPPGGAPEAELWRLAPAGLARLSPGTPVESADALAVVRDGLFARGFVAAGTATALYRYCGAGDVVALTDPFGGSDPEPAGERAIAFAGRLFFAAEDAAGQELWAFDSSHLFCDDFESGDTSWWSSSVP